MSLIQLYAQNESALGASKRLDISYVSAKNYYDIFRLLCAQICENEYESLKNEKCEYEEYYYLENSKKIKREAIFDSHNFITFDFNNHIYTLLLPSPQMYKTQMPEENNQYTHINQFKKFKRDSKIIKVSKHINNIVKFWEYFEKSILKYKGINNEKFRYFLKEFEFKYNHPQDEVIELLIKQYFKDER